MKYPIRASLLIVIAVIFVFAIISAYAGILDGNNFFGTSGKKWVNNLRKKIGLNLIITNLPQ